MKGICVESYDRSKDRWVDQGIGLSAFTHERVMDAQLAAPKPFLLQSVLKAASEGAEWQFLGPDEQGYANGGAGAGLDVLGHWMQRDWNVANEFPRTVGSMAHMAYVRDHRGYRINRLIHEDWIRHVDIFLTFGYQPLASFDIAKHERPIASSTFEKRTVYYMDRDLIAKVAPGMTTSFVLQHTPPVCQFTRAEQRLLAKAIDGLTDQQIAEVLGLSLNTLKSTWRSIYDRVETSVPHALTNGGDTGANGNGRGIEKRRSVIAFVEAHPQEIRPYLRS